MDGLDGLSKQVNANHEMELKSPLIPINLRLNPMDVFEAIGNRRSVRAFRSDPIPEEVLDKILEAARWADLDLGHPDRHTRGHSTNTVFQCNHL